MWSTSFARFEGPLATADWPTRPIAAPLAATVVASMAAVGALGGNPSSVHRLGQRARVRVEKAEADMLALLGLPHGSFAYAEDATAATHLAIEQALQRQCGPRGGHVRWLGATRRFAPGLGLLLRWRGGHVDALSDAQVSWRADDASAAPDVVVVDVWDPVTGVALPAARVAAKRPGGAHLHAVVGAYGLQHHGEAWPWPTPLADSLSIASAAVGGPPGLAACVSLRPDAPLTPAGTVPKELVVGMGTAAQLRATSRDEILPQRFAHRARLEAALAAMGPGSGLPNASAAARCSGRIYVPGVGIANWPADVDSRAQLVPWRGAPAEALAALGWTCDGADPKAQDAQTEAVMALCRTAPSSHH